MEKVDNKLFEGIDTRGVPVKELQNSKKLYAYLLESARKADMKYEPLDEELDEGIITGLLGGVTGAVAGPVVMKSICRILGISESGTLGKLLTSSMVCAALGAEIAR